MPLGPVEHLALFPFDNGFLGEEVFSHTEAPFSVSQSDPDLPFEAHHVHQLLPHAAVRLQDPYLRCDRDLGWNIDWAVAFVVDRLEQNWANAAASLKNIRLRAAALYEDGLSEEIPLRIFDKLDRLLFAGCLKNAVFLDASSLSARVSGATYTHGRGPDPEVKRISIIINRDVLRNGQPRDIVVTLIHHMIHAYFLVACGGQKQDEVSYGRLAHDVQFGKIMLTIKRLSTAHGRELICLDYRHHSPGVQNFGDEYHSPWRRNGAGHEDRNVWYCSQCHCDVQGHSEGEVDRWYKKVCKPMFDQPHSVRKLEVQVYNCRRRELEKKRRARLVSSTCSVEFVCKGEPVLVEKEKIEQFRSIMRAFDRAASRFLKVHKDVSKETFMRFLEFLHTRSYRPDPRSFAAAVVAYGLNTNHKGPPIIQHQNVFPATGIVLADVQFVKFSMLMGFDDCKSYALDRMNTYCIMYEDPVAVLKEIYRGDEPDPDLRVWARKFLTHTTSPSSLACRHGNWVGHDTMEMPNLLKLENHHGPYCSRFLDAIDSNEALVNDVDKAREKLEGRGWYVSPGLLIDRPRSVSAHHRHIPHPSFLPDSASLSSSSSSSSWLSVHNFTTHLSSLFIDHVFERERDGDRIEVNHDNLEARLGFTKEHRQKDVESELDRARKRVRKLERKKKGSRKTQTEVKVQAVALVEELLERGLMGRRDVDDY